MKSIPPTTTDPKPLMDAPLPGTPFTVVKSRFVSYSHSSDPSFVDQPRTPPSFDPVKTTPRITVTAAKIAALQPRTVPHFGASGGATQLRSPVASFTACKPPGCCEPMVSETEKYA